MTALTPGQFADELAQRYAPDRDPLMPFLDPYDYARRRLTAQALAEVYGAQHPLSRLVMAYSNYDRVLDPTPEYIEGALDKLQEAYDDLTADLQ
jgi:hypothetical protein